MGLNIYANSDMTIYPPTADVSCTCHETTGRQCNAIWHVKTNSFALTNRSQRRAQRAKDKNGIHVKIQHN